MISAGVAQLVEHLSSKQMVAGSNPVTRSRYTFTVQADITASMWRPYGLSEIYHQQWYVWDIWRKQRVFGLDTWRACNDWIVTVGVTLPTIVKEIRMDPGAAQLCKSCRHYDKGCDARDFSHPVVRHFSDETQLTTCQGFVKAFHEEESE